MELKAFLDEIRLILQGGHFQRLSHWTAEAGLPRGVTSSSGGGEGGCLVITDAVASDPLKRSLALVWGTAVAHGLWVTQRGVNQSNMS